MDDPPLSRFRLRDDALTVNGVPLRAFNSG